ncbi:hypothetical protein K4A76_11845 [Pseudomonas sp. NEEL19]|uniref:3'-5' exonuclease n=1 Tax=Pseudomonas sp. NEEL19 TaxID=2867409 RepID=UPI002367CC73|nr:3'-5' exonuclease [Pseudomonas sp. NEEL19]WDM57187.1 hypothetical protein K4A76_11845 [Pseudomonas sp. NEEL19]
MLAVYGGGDAVILFGINQGDIPNARDNRSTSALREARRLFYVGVTRPRRELCLVYQGNNQSPWVDELYRRSLSGLSASLAYILLTQDLTIKRSIKAQKSLVAIRKHNQRFLGGAALAFGLDRLPQLLLRVSTVDRQTATAC